MQLICHANIEAAVNLSSDNTEKKLTADLWNPPTIDKGTESNVRAGLWHLSES